MRLSKKPAGPRIINYRIKESLSGYEIHCKIALYKKQQRKQKNRTTVRFLRFLSFARGQYLGGPQKAIGLFGERRNARLK